MLFGSDAATDGGQHFLRNPASIELIENLNHDLLRLVQRLEPDVARRLLQDNARALLAIPPPVYRSRPRSRAQQ